MSLSFPSNWRINPSREFAERRVDRVALVDIDGVLADASHRQYLLKGEHRRWREFFEACAFDPVIKSGSALVDALDLGLEIVLLTARPNYVGDLTVEWLQAHRVRWDILITRDHVSHESARQYKENEVRNALSFGFDPVIALEDDPRNVAMYQELDIPCVYVYSGYYE